MTAIITWLLLVLPLSLVTSEPLSKGTYFAQEDRMIKHINSGRCLSMSKASRHSGNSMCIYSCDKESGWDLYQLVSYAENEWYIKFLWAPKTESEDSWACVVQPYGGNRYVHSQTCSDSNDYEHQRWSFIDTGNYRWLIKSHKSGLCMRPSGNDDYAEVRLVDCDANDSQQLWSICDRTDRMWCGKMEQIVYGSQAICCGMEDHIQDVKGPLQKMVKQCEKKLRDDPTYCNAENIKPILENV